ncbi:transcription factor bHLH94-like [Prosopis cineraria]|uniref:transcription factor bHLH94-like n=1 Tax=Prosopis cineraria TaxID=364024 RepID=UPI00240F0C79|nr:transcription factor bHLH94-like [Prosopis cineraria]
MVLEAVVYPPDPLSYAVKDNLYPFGLFLDDSQQHHPSLDFLHNNHHPHLHAADWDCSSPPHFSHVPLSNPSSSDPTNAAISLPTHPHLLDSAPAPVRPKRRRPKTRKNQQEIENQRMTHIAVERNRRKQMNDYLSVLRSLMPDSYVQRGDQASIIGGAINFVKELEQRLQFLGSQKQTEGTWESSPPAELPFSEFFAFPQYSATSSGRCDSNSGPAGEGSEVDAIQSGIADIEVTMVESHANLKIRSQKRPKQLLKIVSGLHSMCLTIMHLNVTTTAQIVLYCLSVKVEDDCKLCSVDDIAAALFQMMDSIHREALLC